MYNCTPCHCLPLALLCALFMTFMWGYTHDIYEYKRLVNFLKSFLLWGFYLPYVMLAFDLLLRNPLMPEILGMVVGHLYYFLTVLHPLAGGKFILKTLFGCILSIVFLYFSNACIKLILMIFFRFSGMISR